MSGVTTLAVTSQSAIGWFESPPVICLSRRVVAAQQVHSRASMHISGSTLDGFGSLARKRKPIRNLRRSSNTRV
jgi:hypothetical protein